MILSMTGFGATTIEFEGKNISVDIKSVNSKGLDLTMKLPPLYRDKEMSLRQLIQENVIRGKVDVNIYFSTTDANLPLPINVNVVKGYAKQLEKINKTLPTPLTYSWDTLMRLPDVLKKDTDADTEIDEDEADALSTAFYNALKLFDEFRKTEGAALEKFFEEKVVEIQNLLTTITPLEKARITAIKKRYKEAIANIKDIQFDSSRLEQELFYYIEKLDITEEKERLKQHIAYFLDTLADDNILQGKKLNFILQEMGREINTLGAKANHPKIQQIVVEMKDILEQMKEQVLNVL